MEKRIVVITSDYLYTFVSEAYKEINLCKQPLSAASRAAFPGQSGPY